MFAVFDHVLGVSQGASVHAVLGVAHAQALKAFETAEGLTARARRKRKSNETADDDANKVASEQRQFTFLSFNIFFVFCLDKVAEWKVTSFFSLPRERRWALITDVQRNYQRLCVTEPKEQLAEMDAASLQRKEEKKMQEIGKFKKRFDNYHKHQHITPITDVEAINEVDDVETLRDQIRLRTSVYQMKVSARIGDGKGQDELERLRRDLAEVEVETPLPSSKPPAPPPAPIRAAHPAPTADAVALDREHCKQMSEAWGEVCELTHAGVFQAPRATRPKRGARRQDPSPRDQGLVGVAFSESSVSWKVVSVDWCPADKAVVVWYCDSDLAATTGTGAEIMKQFARRVAAGQATGPCPSCLEFSTVREVRAWIREI
jgi:hypothetical protein